MVPTGQGQSGKGQSGQRKPRQEQSRQRKRLQSQSTQRKEVKQNYRDLLNSVITDAAARTYGRSEESLATSRIGASLWTSHEKESLFRRMGLSGRHDLPLLHRAVPTKSEAEIHVYLQLLEQQRMSSTFDMTDMPAAAEVSEECERALVISAIILSKQINDRDTALQQADFGENWLIDEESAYYIDLVYDQSPEDDGKSQEEESEHEDAKSSVSNDPPLIAESDASITLLRPSSFLQLSRSLFMNSSESPDYNWQQADLLEESVPSPAVFRGAFEDLHNIVVSLTRRLVQVSLFQALTRLRAGDSSRHDWSPAPLVREVDVHSALDVLGMKPDAHEYWATAARRCKVNVLTESKKYLDGRQGSKTGVTLTYEEVEAELGLSNRGENVIEEQSRDFIADSDMYTETDTDEGPELRHDDEQETRPARSSSISRKRKRALSPTTYLRSETKHLNAIDHNATVYEESRLWKVLRMGPPAGMSLQEVKVPDHPGQWEVVGDDWKRALKYEAEWEHPDGCVEHNDFSRTEKTGAQARRRREEQLNQWGKGVDEDGSEESEEDEEDEMEDMTGDKNEANVQETEGTVESDPEMADEESGGLPEGSDKTHG